MSSDDDKRADGEDVLFFHGKTEDGEGLRAIRKRKAGLELCSVRTARDGEPIHGELASLKPRTDAPHLYDVKVHYAPPAAEQERQASGPAKVTSPTYRTGWDRIWGKSKRSMPN